MCSMIFFFVLYEVSVVLSGPKVEAKSVSHERVQDLCCASEKLNGYVFVGKVF